MCTIGYIASLYRLHIATEEGFRHIEYHDTKIENAGLFQVFAIRSYMELANDTMLRH